MPSKNKLEELVSLLFATGQLIRENKSGQKGAVFFPIMKIETLRFIDAGADITMRDIARYLCITPPSATFLVNGLVKSGYLLRVADKSDRRVVRLIVTERGRKVIQNGFKKIVEQIKSVLIKLDVREQEEFIRILKKISATCET